MNLYIIGNGFDISHRLKCSYLDFYNFLNDNDCDALTQMQEFYYLGEDALLWSEFESALESEIDYEPFRDIIIEDTPSFHSDDFRESDWEDAKYNVKYKGEELLDSIRVAFTQWIESINNTKTTRIHNLSMTDLYINFNYTTLLQNVYQIPDNQILHVHNKVGADELIFGHGINLQDFDVKAALYQDIYTEHQHPDDTTFVDQLSGHEQFAEESVEQFFEAMRKKTEEVIRKNNHFFTRLHDIEQIIVIGHSYNDIDYPYFEEVYNSTPENTHWLLHWFSDDDLFYAEQLMKKLGIPENLYGMVQSK